MRSVTVGPPSFPQAPENTDLSIVPDIRWQVLCGDEGHWRAGVYSPPESSRDELDELERHDCPELFLLIEGRLILACWVDGGIRELELQPGRPVLVTAPHSGYCPDGAHTGSAFVVERDILSTEYRTEKEWADL